MRESNEKFEKDIRKLNINQTNINVNFLNKNIPRLKSALGLIMIIIKIII